MTGVIALEYSHDAKQNMFAAKVTGKKLYMTVTAGTKKALDKKVGNAVRGIIELEIRKGY